MDLGMPGQECTLLINWKVQTNLVFNKLPRALILTSEMLSIIVFSLLPNASSSMLGSEFLTIFTSI